MIDGTFHTREEKDFCLLFENTTFIKAYRCNINQLNNNIFEQHQYCFCCVVIVEVLTHRLTDKLVLSWLLVFIHLLL